jgi:hypothetical protein
MDGGMSIITQPPASQVTEMWNVSDAAPHDRLVGSVYFLIKTLRTNNKLANGAIANMLANAYTADLPVSCCDEFTTVLAQCNKQNLLFKDILPVLCSPMNHAKTGVRYTATPFCHTVIAAGLELGTPPAAKSAGLSGRGAYASAIMLMKRANLIPEFSASYQQEKSIDRVNGSSYDLDVYECRRAWRETSLLLVLRRHTAPMHTSQELLALYDAVSGGGFCVRANCTRKLLAIVVTHVFYFSATSLQPIASLLLRLTERHNQ